MKKKLTINALAGSNLKSRKKQYTLLILGIILAMVFSSGTIFLASCLSTSIAEMNKIAVGSQDYIYVDSSEELMKKASEDGFISEYGFAYDIGKISTEYSGDENVISVGYFDDKAKELYYLSISEGVYPQNEDEIAIEKSSLMWLAPDAKIGDVISFDLYIQNHSGYIEEPVQKSYKLVGIMKNKHANIESDFSAGETVNLIPSAYVCDNAVVEAGGKELLVSFVKQVNINDNVYDYMQNNNGFSAGNFVSTSGYHNYTSAYSMENKISFAVVFIVVLLIASCIGIINSFNSNLKDRKKQIGMFRTVGATKKQIITIFGREAFFISLICTPVSILISYFLVYFVAKAMGEDFIFIPNLWVLAACAVFSIVCVMLAALIPLISASRISPIQSIRNIEYARKMKVKRIKSQKSFNPSNLLAKREMSFKKGSQVLVSIILVITIVGSCYGFSVAENSKEDMYKTYLTYDYEMGSDGGRAIYGVNARQYETGYAERDLKNILLSPYVSSVYGAQACNAYFLLDDFTDYFKALYVSETMSFYDERIDDFYIPSDDEVSSFIQKRYDESMGRLSSNTITHRIYLKAV